MTEPDASFKQDISSLLRTGANMEWQLGLTELQVTQFTRYAEILVEWNANRMNLTRLISPWEITVKHFLDSLALLKVTKIPENAVVIDIGTGSGLPGLALKIARPDLKMVLMDSTAKKLSFCRAAIEALGLADAETVHARAEDAARWPMHRACYDVVLARAVAPLERLLPLCAPFARPKGLLALYKGASAADELAAAQPIARRLGLTALPAFRVTLPQPGDGEALVRHLILFRPA